MRRFFAVALVLLPAFTLPALRAQQPATEAPSTQPAPPTAANTIHRNIPLVFLDGVALDSRGHVVTDLTRSDFTVTEDGAPQRIRHFDAPGQDTPASTITIDSTADLDRLAPRAPVNIVVLDEFTTRFEDMAFARYSLKKWLESQPVKLDTPTMLIAVDLKHFQVLHDYTQNKDEILNSLDHHFAAYPWKFSSVEWSPDLIATAHQALRQVAEASEGHLGHKNLIWIGRGFPTLFHHTRNLDAGRNHGTTQHTIDELRQARVTLYTIDPAGVMTNPGEYGAAAAFDAPFGGDPRFQALATATGGRNLYGRNDVDAEIGASIRDGANLYSIIYSPADDSDSHKFRTIKVTIDRPGITFVTRPGYFPFSTTHAAEDGTMKGRLANEMLSAGANNLTYDAVHFTAQVNPTNTGEIGVHLDGQGISYYIPKDESKPRHTRIIVVATTFDKKNKPLKNAQSTFNFTAPDAPHIGHITTPLNFGFRLAPDPKATHVRVVLRVEASGHMGTVDLPLTPGATASSAATEAATDSPSAKPATPPPGM